MDCDAFEPPGAAPERVLGHTDSGDPERIVEMRHEFQHMMTKRFTETIEELTGRKVLAFLSQAHVEPDLTLEIFFVDGPLEGFGAVELVQPE
jgi:uncharacterized protein YbcI